MANKSLLQFTNLAFIVLLICFISLQVKAQEVNTETKKTAPGLGTGFESFIIITTDGRIFISLAGFQKHLRAGIFRIGNLMFRKIQIDDKRMNFEFVDRELALYWDHSEQDANKITEVV
ncbi:MAG: hypothetical protein IPN29_20395 [Saprospiraceae bacterium]|nr:hypothetical protein [Saprospiraceae bacterium]